MANKSLTLKYLQIADTIKRDISNYVQQFISCDTGYLYSLFASYREILRVLTFIMWSEEHSSSSYHRFRTHCDSLSELLVLCKSFEKKFVDSEPFDDLPF